MKKVIISGYYGFDNSGDDAILKAIVKDLKESNKFIDITVLSNNPKSTVEIYNVKAINRFNIISVMKEIASCDMLISGGGSLLQDITSTRSIMYYIAIMQIAKMFKKPVMVYANGIGPINKKINRILTRNILNKVDLITLRDADSSNILKNIKVNNDNIFITADPVFTLEVSDFKRIKEIFEIEGIPFDKPAIGIALREWDNSQKLVECLANALNYFTTKHDVNIIFIPMHYPEDLKISKSVIKKVEKNSCYLIKNKYPVEDIMGIIGSLELIIAMRLHSLIYAATQAIPMIGVVYDPKVESFLNMIDIKERCDIRNVNFLELSTIIDKAWENRFQTRNKLSEKQKEYKEKALENVVRAINLLESR